MSRRFLVSRLSALGDVVLTLPAAVALRRSFPDSEIVWVVDRRFAGIVECCRAVDRRHVVDRKRLFEEVRSFSESFDVAFDLQGLLKSALFVRRARAPLKLGYHWMREGAWLFSQRVWPDPSSRHLVDQLVDVVRAGGAHAGRAEFDLAPLPEDAERVHLELRRRGVDEPFVLMNAGAGWPEKRWPPRYFARLCEMLAAAGIQSVFLGAPTEQDRDLFHQVVSEGARSAISMVGETSVRELVALVAQAAVHVGGDTGSTHVAAALGIPAIGLYAATDPERTGPYGQGDRVLFDPRGLDRIDPQAVFARVLEVLD